MFRRRGFGRILFARYRTYIFLALITLLFLHQGFYSGHNTHPDINLSPVGTNFKLNALTKATAGIFFSKGVLTEHPIPKLMNDAEDEFRNKLQKQSKTLPDAVEEYRKRYKRNPPKGFDEWWEFMRQNEVRMVDEFDGLMSDLEPFWSLSGQEIRRRTLQVGELPSIHLVRIRGGESTTVKMNHAYQDSEVSARAKGFLAMILPFASKLPDMDFAINAKAEGRVVVPWEHRNYPNMTIQDSSKGVESVFGGQFIPDWNPDEDIWEAWRRTCPPDTPARRLFSSRRNPFASKQTTDYISLASPEVSIDESVIKPGSDFKFMSSTNANVDFCLHPHMHTSQGHFFSDWRAIPALYPVFTPARSQGFMDIRVPSHYYYGSTERYTYGWDSINLELKDVDPMEVSWEDKIDIIFWRGATTGGGSRPPGFAPQYQRHRFLRMTSLSSDTTSLSSNTTSPSPSADASSSHQLITFADPPKSNRYITASVPLAHLNDEIMDAAFVKAVAGKSYPGGEAALRRDHRFGDAVPLGEHWRYKYLVDLDGMSYSGRFLAFLASDSVPIKSTVYEEWFSDWIQPWVHFIPLSTTYREIYNIVAYFSGPTPSTLLAANSSLPMSSSPRILSEIAQKALQNQEVLQQTKSGRKLLRNVEAERRLKRIARAGKEWKRTMGRKVDMEAYVYRLCLEWARLWADDRDSMDYRP